MTKSYHYIFGIFVIIVILLLFSFAPRSCSSEAGEDSSFVVDESGSLSGDGDSGQGESPNNPPSSDATISELYLNKVQLDLVVNETEQLTASVVMSDGSDYTGSYKWSSSSEEVALVSQTGLVSAISEGSSYVQVTVDDGQYAICVVNVTDYQDPNQGDQGQSEYEGDEKNISPQDVFKASFPNTDKYFYRVGNENEVELSYIFDVIEGYEDLVDDVEISYNAVEDDSEVTVKYEKNTEDWKKGTLDFSGTGLICLTISAYATEEEYEELFDEYSIKYFDDDNDLNGKAPEGDILLNSFDLYLEVESGGNVTSMDDLSGKDDECDVLLSDIYTDTFKVLTYKGNSRLFGNGFTLTVDARSPYSTGAICLEDNARMDHLTLIVNEHYDVYTLTDPYNIMFNDAIDCSGKNITIANCYISGGRAAVRNRADNLLIRDSVIEGGAYANVLVSSESTVTLENVTTNQYLKYDDNGKERCWGFGLLVEYAGDGSTIILNGDVKQYNWISEYEAENYFTYSMESYGSDFADLFGDGSALYDYEILDDDEIKINTGVMGFDADFTFQTNLTNGVVYTPITVIERSYSGYIEGYTINAKSSSNIYTDFVYDPEEISDYGVVEPTFHFNVQSGDNGSGSTLVYNEDNGLVTITISPYDELGLYSWKPEPIIEKYGFPLEVQISLDKTDEDPGIDITENGYVFSRGDEGDHYVTYSYTDPFNYRHNDDNEVESYDIDYTQTLHILVVVEEFETAHAEFKFSDNSGNEYPTTVVEVNYKKYVTIDTESEEFDSNSADIVEYFVQDENGDNVSLYAPKEYSSENSSLVQALTKDLYWYYPLLQTITVTDYVGAEYGEDKENAYTYNSKDTTTNTNHDGTSELFSFGEETPFEVLTPSDNYWSGSYNGSHCTFAKQNNVLCIVSNVRNSADSYAANEWIGEFTYTDEAGQIYYYGIDFYRAAHN